MAEVVGAGEGGAVGEVGGGELGRGSGGEVRVGGGGGGGGVVVAHFWVFCFGCEVSGFGGVSFEG